MERLTPAQIEDALAALPEWSLREGKLHRDMAFADFAETFAFMTRVAGIAEALQHHPEWSNVYNRLTIDLTTHDAGGISAKDVELATRVEAVPRETT